MKTKNRVSCARLTVQLCRRGSSSDLTGARTFNIKPRLRLHRACCSTAKEAGTSNDVCSPPSEALIRSAAHENFLFVTFTNQASALYAVNWALQLQAIREWPHWCRSNKGGAVVCTVIRLPKTRHRNPACTERECCTMVK